MVFSFSNFLSFSRFPLAFVFLQSNPLFRFWAILLAMVTDSVDGYFARKAKNVSRFGMILDPVMDKFFVLFALGALYVDGSVTLWEVAAMLSRDMFLCLYGLGMVLRGQARKIELRSIRWGKVTTALQFLVLMGLCQGWEFSWALFAAFVVMGWLAFLELF